MSISPFDFVNAITYNKQDMFAQDQKYSDSQYNKFLINKALSYFPDTILYANEANRILQEVPNQSHFDFYRFVVEKKRRFAKWAKKTDNQKVDLLCKHYQVNIDVARQYAEIISDEDYKYIESLYDKGGS